MNDSLRKKDVSVSFAYRLEFLTLMLVGRGLGDASMGMTAGRGIDGAGLTERRDEEKEDLRLWLTMLGGFIGNAIEVGVPGAEGTGEPMGALVLLTPGIASKTAS